MRVDGRANDELRPILFERNFTDQTPGSVLVSFGRTKVLCTVSIDDDVPRWMRGNGEGWVTAEYAMLPGSSGERVGREAKKGKQKGRTLEIERLIGRALRAVCDMTALGEREVTVDCDVLQADGGHSNGVHMRRVRRSSRRIYSTRIRRHTLKASPHRLLRSNFCRRGGGQPLPRPPIC